MSQLDDLAQKENVNLDECIVFTKDSGDFLAVNIKYVAQTGAIPVNYRGLSNVSKKVSNNPDAIFEVSLIMQQASNMPKDNYLEPTCDCCSLKHIL